MVTLHLGFKIFDTFGPSTLLLSGRQLYHFRTVHFDTFGPSSLILSDRPLWLIWTVHFDTLIYPEGPSTFSWMTDYFDPWPSTLIQKTVHYRPGPSTFAWPSTFTLSDRPLWTWLLPWWLCQIYILCIMSHFAWIRFSSHRLTNDSFFISENWQSVKPKIENRIRQILVKMKEWNFISDKLLG